jgi:hypothetical protein
MGQGHAPLTGFSLRRLGFALKTVHAGFIFEKLETEARCLQVLWFPLSVSLHNRSHSRLFVYLSPRGWTVDPVQPVAPQKQSLTMRQVIQMHGVNENSILHAWQEIL